ncbi:hypothetical protein [Streptodolium elevatio]|uniref:Uncharacterized protein n=1 Tax=Streptodolium elevatio TaxID=3157996 RepID=A0ABV3DSN2_9ACTN
MIILRRSDEEGVRPMTAPRTAYETPPSAPPPLLLPIPRPRRTAQAPAPHRTEEPSLVAH